MTKGTKAILISMFVILGFISKTSGQRFGHSIQFSLESTDTRSMVRQSHPLTVQDHRIWSVYRYITRISTYRKNVKPRSPMLLGVKLNSEAINTFGPDIEFYTKKYTSYIISDSTDAKIIALGITNENVNEYQYHVVKNDSIELIPWSPIPEMEQKYGAERSYANLGTYNSPGNQILVEVKSKNDYFIRDGVVFDWRINFRPIVTQIAVSTSRNYFNL